MPADCVMAASSARRACGRLLQPLPRGAHRARQQGVSGLGGPCVHGRRSRVSGAELLPVDCEHSAAFQALCRRRRRSRSRRSFSRLPAARSAPGRARQLDAATPEQALKHPNWSMGAKVTIDSATLDEQRPGADRGISPFPGRGRGSSIASSIRSRSCIASSSYRRRLGAGPDLRRPTCARRLQCRSRGRPHGSADGKLDLARLGPLTFEAPDEVRFPALRVAKAALRRGDTAPAVLNAANEVAVKAFLDRRLKFLDIASLVEATIDEAERAGCHMPGTLPRRHIACRWPCAPAGR